MTNLAGRLNVEYDEQGFPPEFHPKLRLSMAARRAFSFGAHATVLQIRLMIKNPE